MRTWGGIMDMTMDGSPIIGKLPVKGLYDDRRLVLRRLQGDAGVGLAASRTRSRATRRTRSTPRSRSSASPKGG